jgi:hypothetical protein
MLQNMQVHYLTIGHCEWSLAWRFQLPLDMKLLICLIATTIAKATSS